MTDEQFEDLFERFMLRRRLDMKNTFNRVLPSGELIFNRFDKSKFLQCGECSSVYDTSVIFGDVIIGSHVWVGPYTLLEGSNGRLVIGDYVSINAGVMIYTHDSTKHYISGGVDDFAKGDVLIGSYTVIGSMSMVSCGVKIGSHCVIGAYSMVKEDIPDNSIVAGVPSKIIGKTLIDEVGKVSFCYFSESGKSSCNE